jgi:hypothetical protein
MADDIHLDGAYFKDEHGRTRMWRGINLGGSSKVPSVPPGATHLREGFLDSRQVSFVGRPFPLEEAGEHFSRLKRWGFNLLRFLVTWEAIEHRGPGIYDQDYLAYVEAVLRKAGEYGFKILIDPHQDVWSRFSGGDGAPGWTLEAIGLELANLHASGAAFLHPFHEGPLPAMIWPTNATKLAAATLFTLFFAGNDFAPRTMIAGEPVQEYLQRHYLDAMQALARRIKDLPQVLGWEAMNEPLRGYIGWEDLSRPKSRLKLGAMPSPYQSMLLGEGIPQNVENWEMSIFGPRRSGQTSLNPQGQRAWQPGHECIWQTHGVWGYDDRQQPRLLQPDYFTKVAGRPVDFNRDYYIPFLNRFAQAIRTVQPGAILFIEEDEFELQPPKWSQSDAANVVFAPHWYDGLVLILKKYLHRVGYDEASNRLLVGSRRIDQAYRQQLARIKAHANQHMGNIPILIGETGIPFDLSSKQAYKTGNFSAQIRAMDRTLRAMEANLISYCLWNYTADNNPRDGDLWNQEDLSIFSNDQRDDPADLNSGGRALEAVVRPFAIATAGEPLEMSFDLHSRVFTYRFQHDPAANGPTEIFVPALQYPRGWQAWVSDGSFEAHPEGQLLAYRPGAPGGEHLVRIAPAKKI